MKQQQPQSISTRQKIINFQAGKLNKPNPPTAEAIKKAQFVDKTYHWTNARIRSGE